MIRISKIGVSQTHRRTDSSLDERPNNARATTVALLCSSTKSERKCHDIAHTDHFAVSVYYFLLKYPCSKPYMVTENNSRHLKITGLCERKSNHCEHDTEMWAACCFPTAGVQWKSVDTAGFNGLQKTQILPWKLHYPLYTMKQLRLRTIREGQRTKYKTSSSCFNAEPILLCVTYLTPPHHNPPHLTPPPEGDFKMPLIW